MASWSKSCQKVEESSKSPKNLKGLKCSKSHRFGGTFTKAPVFHQQKTRTSVRTLTVFRTFFAGPRSVSLHQSFYLRNARLPSATSALECTPSPLALKRLKNSFYTSSLLYLNPGDALQKKTSQPRIRADMLDGWEDAEGAS